MSGQKTRHQKLNNYLVMSSLGAKNLDYLMMVVTAHTGRIIY